VAELIEGSGVSQFKDIMKQLTYIKSADIEFATILAPPPSIRVVVDGMKIELDADDLAICESLTKTTRNGTVNGGDTVIIEIDNALKAGDRVVIASINKGQLYVILDRLGSVI
jgi:hypothetical protein